MENIYVNGNILQTKIISINNTSSYNKSILVFINDLTVNTNSKLQLELKANNTVSEGGTIFISLHGKSTITTTTTGSDDRRKHNEIPITNALDSIMKLQCETYDKTFVFKDENYKNIKSQEDFDEFVKSFKSRVRA